MQTDSRCVSDEVYANLLDNIEKGVWKKGEKIPSENQLCKIYGISRISARSAIQRLQAQNLIATYPGKGSFVTVERASDGLLSMAVKKMDLAEHEYRYMTQLRQALEFTSIDLICQYGTDEDIARTKKALDQMIAAGSNSKKYTDADYAFHFSLIEGSHNPLFISMYKSCQSSLYKYFFEMAEVSNGDFSKAIGNHTAMYECLKNRDAAGMKHIIERTFEYNRKRFKSFFREEHT